MLILRNGGIAIRSGMASFVELGYKYFRKRYYVLNYFIYKIHPKYQKKSIINKMIERIAYGYQNIKSSFSRFISIRAFDPKLSA